ncbi:hypothetical protein Tco_0088636 [Tanacetum coccineum]
MGHTRDGCFRRIGYPEWWPGKKSDKEKPMAACAEVDSRPLASLTKEQYEAFLKDFALENKETRSDAPRSANMADWKLLFFDSAVSIDAADLDAASTVFAACIVSAEIFISADGIKSFLLIMFLLVMFSFLLTEIESAGHVLVSADRDRIC